jgi:hypothetical protein
MESIFPSTSQYVNRVRRTDGTYMPIDESVDALDNGNLIAPETQWNEMVTDVSMSSKDKMKAEIQQNWKTVTQKLIEETMQQQIPFTVPTGTRIMVFLNEDIMLRIDDDMEDMLGDRQYEQGQ